MHTQEASVAPGRPAAQTSEVLGAYLQIDLLRLLYWLRRGIKWIVIGTCVGLLLAVAYAVTAKPRYTVTTDILIDPTGLQIVSGDLYGRSDQRDTQLLNVESKRQTLLSRSVLLRAVRELGLQNDAEFAPPPSMFGVLRALIGRGGGAASQSAETRALETLRRRVEARRDEVSFVVTMSVWTQDATKSIAVSEAIITAFREELVASDTEGARRSVDALAARIGELKAEVNAADEAVEAFRRQNRLQSSQGELISSRSMSQINQQLVEARQRLIAAESRYEDLSSPEAAEVAAMVSPTVSALRAQHIALKSEVAALSRDYGPLHPRLVRQNTALASLEGEIEAEIRRVVAAARSDLEQARLVVAGLEEEAAAAGSSVFTDNDAEIRLRELTREAAAKAAVYEAFLNRAEEIAERQQLDTTNIRVISPPVLPRSRSWPPSTMQAASFGIMAGLVLSIMGVLGFGIATDIRNGPARPARRPDAAPPAAASPDAATPDAAMAAAPRDKVRTDTVLFPPSAGEKRRLWPVPDALVKQPHCPAAPAIPAKQAGRDAEPLRRKSAPVSAGEERRRGSVSTDGRASPDEKKTRAGSAGNQSLLSFALDMRRK